MISARLSASSSFSSLVSLLKRSLNVRMMAVVVAVVALLGGAQTAWAGDGCATTSALSGLRGPDASGVLYTSGEVLTVTLTGTETLTIGNVSATLATFTYPSTTVAAYTIPSTGTYILSWTTSNFTVSCSLPQTTFTVTTTTDDASGVAANCATGGSSACTLRDALAAAAASTSTGLLVNFSPSVFLATNTAAQNTITETHGTLNLPSNTTIQGLTTGSGAALTNLVSVNGNAANTVFTMTGTTTGVVLNNLIITNGYALVSGGGGIRDASSGTLAVNQCTISGNSASAGADGGGIFATQNLGVVSITNSTISGNTAKDGTGGITAAGITTIANSTIANNVGVIGGVASAGGVLTITHSTISGNNASAYGGGLSVFSYYTTNLINSIVAGNTATGGSPDVDQTPNTNTGNIVGTYTGPGASSGSGAALAPLGFYGGPTQTMPNLPSSSAFCASTGTGTDQRGVTIPATYGGSTHCVDVGATNSSYSLVFTTQPGSSYYVSQRFSPAPVLSFEDDGAVVPATGSVSFNDFYSAYSGLVSSPLTSGAVTVSPAAVYSVETADYLIATCTLPITGSPVLSVNSSTFNIVPSVNHLTLTSVPTTTTAGSSFMVTVTAYTSTDSSVVATGYTGPIKVTSTDTSAALPANFSLTNGTASFSVTLKTTLSQTITAADTSGTPTVTSGSVAVTAASASTITAASGSGKSAVIGSAFTLPLQAQVLDAYSNAISGNVVTFTAPTTGASASLSAATCTTSSAGTCSVTATANGTASTTAYSVTAKATGVTTGATFSLTNTAVTPTLTVTASPTTLVYGQPVTITATSVPASAGGSSPMGAVTFYDNTTTLTPTSTPTAGVATYSTTALVGAQVYGASTAGDTNFTAVTKTTAASITVGKASSTLTGPVTQPVLVTVGTSGPIAISVAGQYSGTGVLTPSGSVGYTIGSPCAASCTGTALIATGAASISLPTTLSPGVYNLAVTYAGDPNYAAATTINVSVQVGQITPTVTYPAQTAITYGTALTANLNATTAYGGTSLTSGGTTTYTATLGTGTPVPVTTATVLAAGTYTLTATWTPNSTNAVTYKSASGTTTLVVNKAALTVTANPITIVYGQTLPAYTATITGYVNGDTASVVSGAAALSTTPAAPTTVNTYTITPTLGTLAAANYSFATFTTGTLTITQASTLVTLTQTAPLPATGGAGVGVPVTFVVTVADTSSNSTGTPTGQVLLLSGGTEIGSGVLAGGSATISNITFNAAQTASLTAKYISDFNFATNTSTVLTETVVVPTVTVTPQSPTLTITRGTPVSTTITYLDNGNFTGYGTTTCTGLPTGSYCSMTPFTLSFNGTDNTQTSTLTIVTTAPGAKQGALQSGVLWMPAVLLGLLVMVRRKKLSAGLRSLLLLVVAGGVLMSVTGCASNSLAGFGTPTGTSTIGMSVSLTGTGPGSATQVVTTNVTVNVQ